MAPRRRSSPRTALAVCAALLAAAVPAAFATHDATIDYNKCVNGVGGEDLGTTNPHVAPREGVFELPYPCRHYSSRSCCSAIHAAEIVDALSHLIEFGGTYPSEDMCPERYRGLHPELLQYFCMFCDPDQLKYFGCCDAPADDATSCTSTMTLYGEGECTETTVDTLRICRSFATSLWGDDGSHFDGCGMNVYSGADEEDSNPNGIVPWGDVDGTTGDDPILPSKFWGSVNEFFRDTKPPLFDEFLIHVVDDEDGHCFKGSESFTGTASAATLSAAAAATVAAATVALARAL